MTVAPQTVTRAATAYLGTFIFLAAWAMFAAALLFAYGYLRLNAGAWPAVHSAPRLSRLLPFLNVLCLLLGGSALRYALGARGENIGGKILSRTLRFTASLGGVFLIFIGYLWHDLSNRGLSLSGDGNYGGTFFLLTGFYAFNVAIASLGMLIQSFRFSFEATKRWSLFWDFISVGWVGVFFGLFIF